MKPTQDDAHDRLLVLSRVVVHALATPPPDMLAQWMSKWSAKECEDFSATCKQHVEDTVKKMSGMNLWQVASPKEQEFLQSYGSQMDEYAHRAATWRMECVAMLMWALGLIRKWPSIDRQTETDLLKAIPGRNPGLFSKRPHLRSQGEIGAKRDLIELWHWRVRTRRLMEERRHFEPDEQMQRAGINSYDDIVRIAAKTAHEKGDLPEVKEGDFAFLGKPFRDLSAEEYQVATSIIMERHFALNWLCGLAQDNKWDETPTDT